MKEDFLLVKGSEHHLSIIKEIASKTWPSAYGNIITQDQIEYMLNLMYAPEILGQQMRNGHNFYLISSENGYAGFYGLELFYENAPVSKLHKLYVLPDQHGKGLGKALLDHAMAMSIEGNMKGMVLNVNKKNPALSFYLSQGFTIDKEVVLDIGNNYVMDDYVMKKSL